MASDYEIARRVEVARWYKRTTCGAFVDDDFDEIVENRLNGRDVDLQTQIRHAQARHASDPTKRSKQEAARAAHNVSIRIYAKSVRAIAYHRNRYLSSHDNVEDAVRAMQAAAAKDGLSIAVDMDAAREAFAQAVAIRTESESGRRTKCTMTGT